MTSRASFITDKKIFEESEETLKGKKDTLQVIQGNGGNGR